MKISQEIIDEYIERLSSVTATIKSIYEKMKNCQTKEELDKQKEFLAIATEVEDKIYEEIDPKILEEQQFFNRISYLVKISELKDKDDISNRIKAYSAIKNNLNPFPSQIPNPIDSTLENSKLISAQVTLDYCKALLININRELKKERDPEKRKKILDYKYDIYFANKILKKIIPTERNLLLDGRSRCELFNQNEALTAEIYIDYVCTLIDFFIYDILTNDDNINAQINFKSALSILNKIEIFQIARSYGESLKTNPEVINLTANNPNNEIILDIFREFLIKENNTVKPKK